MNTNWQILTENYDYFLIDVWGVLMDGTKAFPKAVALLEYLTKMEKEIVLLSNTPDRAESLLSILDSMGISPNYFKNVMTSGEAVITFLVNNEKFKNLNYRMVGNDRHTSLLHTSDLTMKENHTEYDLLVVTSYDSDFAKKDNLRQLSQKDITILCVNPDLNITTLEGTVKYCAGLLAKEYEEVGGDVTYVGKPYPLIFQLGMNCFTEQNLRRTVMIGDNPLTDIAGAVQFGCDCALVNNDVSSHNANYYFNQFTL